MSDAVTRNTSGGEQPPGVVTAWLRITRPDGSTRDVEVQGDISSPRLVLDGRIPTDPPPQV
jgi:hypothetical protein